MVEDARHPLDNTPRVRRMLQTISDLRRGRLDNCRVLDLGCAHGTYALECARRGATSLGIEGRQSWIDVANQSMKDSGVQGASFQLGDVRYINKMEIGKFDVVLCLGLLYHLNVPDVFNLLESVFDVCTDFAIFDTQIAMSAEVSTHWRGKTYSGSIYREHQAEASAEQKAETLGASLDDEHSFWLTRYSLLNAMKHVGFTSVFEVRNPIDSMHAHGEFKLHEDFVTFVGMKGTSIGPFLSMNPDYQNEEDWPENPRDHFLRRPWSKW